MGSVCGLEKEENEQLKNENVFTKKWPISCHHVVTLRTGIGRRKRIVNNISYGVFFWRLHVYGNKRRWNPANGPREMDPERV